MSGDDVRNRYRALAVFQGSLYLVTGLWPLLNMASFEAVTGPKVDRWLVRTVSGLLITIGVTQLLASSNTQNYRTAASLGVGAATTLATIDATYASHGRISKVYLLDAATQVCLLLSWLGAGRKEARSQ